MAPAGPEKTQGRPPHRWLRDLAAWLLGIATSIAVNLASGKTAAAVRLTLAALAISGALAATYWIRRQLDSSNVRPYILPILLTVASPLILLSVLGTVGGYLMFLAAVLVAVAVSTQEDGARNAFVTLGAIALIAAGPASMETGLRNFSSDLVGHCYLTAGGVLEIAAGIAVLRWNRHLRLLLRIDERMARDFLVISLVAGTVGVVALAGAFSSPALAVPALPLIGSASLAAAIASWNS